MLGFSWLASCKVRPEEALTLLMNGLRSMPI